MAKKKNRQSDSGVAAATPAEIHEAAYFARKCGLTRDEALQMIREANRSAAVKPAESEKRKH
ncbi:hypothetical protein SAMN03159463_04081 [Mesorhizobium sp. NFR06]|uniref:hypothetical protein n=1 Tax=Mesorhizobium sp. NFR06 TaxID=1566290 RepID=UPI0008E234A2|nr:hypothetical protein [Mesorhizobium sp. NFR06]SFP36035.1 hypothetical protein SAMN03159463_04081 [Mesorhizobium sp. NFR06]